MLHDIKELNYDINISYFVLSLFILNLVLNIKLTIIFSRQNIVIVSWASERQDGGRKGRAEFYKRLFRVAFWIVYQNWNQGIPIETKLFSSWCTVWDYRYYNANMDWTTKRDHFIRVKNSRRKGLFTSVVRERYLREDITCRNKICSKCIQGIVL